VFVSASCARYVITISADPAKRGTSRRVYKTPGQGDPRVNIQSKKGKARAYQVRQVLKAIERYELEYGTEE